MSRAWLSRALLAVAMPAVLAGILASGPAPERIAISGVSSLKYSQQHALPVAGAAGPVLLLDQASGTNRNTGKSDYMAGAEVIEIGIADLTQGNGRNQGYTIHAKGADTTVSRWEGKVVTRLGAGQSPTTQFEGSWTKVSGTGKYKGVVGSGTYKGRMLSPTEYTVEWSGEIELKSPAPR